MLPFQTRVLTIFLLTLIISWVFGQLYGLLGALMAALIFLTVLFLHQLWQTHRFTKILMSPTYGDVPGALGIWGEIYYRLHKLVRSWRDQVVDVERQHRRFIEAIQASPNGVIMLNEDDQIEWCNAVAEHHFGMQAKRDTMQRITHILRKPAFVHYITQKNYREPVKLNNMGLNEEYSLEVQIFPYGDKQKLILSQDVSQIEKAEAMRRDFVANVSHELKTPLTVVSGFLETIRDIQISEDERMRYLELMFHQTSRMRNLVDDLLVLAKLEANPEPPVLQPVNVLDMLSRLESDANSLSRGQHQVKLEVATHLDILGEEAEIYSAFSNLVSNAIRYTPEGGVVTLRWSAAEQGAAIFSVTDTGPGIAENHISRITERFYRVDSSRSRDTGGTGLGLAIVKHVVTRHQAELKIDSTLGKGSTFTIVLPEHRTTGK